MNRSAFHPLDMIGEKAYFFMKETIATDTVIDTYPEANFVVKEAIPKKHFCFGCWVRTREQAEERKNPSHMVNMRKESSEMPSST